jgi:hypothetical protein
MDVGAMTQIHARKFHQDPKDSGQRKALRFYIINFL